MKAAMIFLASMGFCSMASAKTLMCTMPTDNTGHAIYGGPMYSLTITSTNVILREMVGLIHAHSAIRNIRMTQVGTIANGAVFQAGDVTAAVTAARNAKGKSVFQATMQIKYEGDIYMADCK